MRRLALFEIAEPPSEAHFDEVVKCIQSCTYPWYRCIPEMRRKGKEGIQVTWEAMGATTGATWDMTRFHITMNVQIPVENVQYAFTHEAGHLVDWATLTDIEREEMYLLMHQRDPLWGHTSPVSPHHTDPTPWGPVTEDWLRGAYYEMFPYEAFARIFQRIWCSPDIPMPVAVRDQEFIYFHEPFDELLPKFKDITTRRVIELFPDIPGPGKPGHNPELWNATNWLSGQGLMKGKADGTFGVGQPMTRDQFALFEYRKAKLEGKVK